MAEARQAREGTRFCGRCRTRVEEIEVVEAEVVEGRTNKDRTGMGRNEEIEAKRRARQRRREGVMEAWLLLAKMEMAAWWSVLRV